MTDLSDRAEWVEALTAPLEVPPRLILRPWSGGDLTRRFRGSPSDGNDHWTEEWIGADMDASNPRPDGTPQGLTLVRSGAGHEARLKDLAEAFPEALLGADHVRRYGTRIGFLLKLVSLSSPAPVHGHPDADFSWRHFGHDQGQSETWMILETRTQDSGLPVGVGFRDGVTRADIMAAIEQRSTHGLRDIVEPMTVEPGDTVYVRSGLPHFISSEVLFLEVQHPSDFTILTEFWSLGVAETDAHLGLGWDTALDAFKMATPEDRGRRAVERARQEPTRLGSQGDSVEFGLIEPHPGQPFDMRRLAVDDSYTVDDGRFSVHVVTDGTGNLEWGAGSRPVRRGDIFAVPATVPIRWVSGPRSLQVHRCVGPAVE
jgi:mannose-6-phosphate isomerase